jgi:hypothetical protein
MIPELFSPVNVLISFLNIFSLFGHSLRIDVCMPPDKIGHRFFHQHPEGEYRNASQ